MLRWSYNLYNDRGIKLIIAWNIDFTPTWASEERPKPEWTTRSDRNMGMCGVLPTPSTGAGPPDSCACVSIASRRDALSLERPRLQSSRFYIPPAPSSGDLQSRCEWRGRVAFCFVPSFLLLRSATLLHHNCWIQCNAIWPSGFPTFRKPCHDTSIVVCTTPAWPPKFKFLCLSSILLGTAFN